MTSILSEQKRLLADKLEYDLNSDAFPELMGLVRQSGLTLATAVAHFSEVCKQLRLT